MTETTPAPAREYQTTPYRFVVLAIFMVVGVINQIMWVSFAPISIESEAFYGVSADWIVFLAASFMLLYIPVNFPACYLIDKYGLKWGVGIGVILTGLFGFTRGLFANNFALVATSQVMIAIGQPFILNAFTKLAATWFPEKEKAIASGLGTMSILLGAIVAMILPELLPTLNIPRLLMGYGIAALVAMLLYLLLAKDKPEHIPNAYADKTQVLVTKGYRGLFKVRDFNFMLVMFFFALGSFNVITTEIDYIFDPAWDSGIISGVMVIGGILGAGVLAGISDAKRKRKIFIQLALVSAVPLSILLIVIQNFLVVCIFSFIFGFFLVSCLPVGLTYAAEITYPAPEETSNGLLMLEGQIAGLILLAVPVEVLMYVVAGLFLIAAVFSFLIEDTPVHELRRAQALEKVTEGP